MIDCFAVDQRRRRRKELHRPFAGILRRECVPYLAPREQRVTGGTHLELKRQPKACVPVSPFRDRDGQTQSSTEAVFTTAPDSLPTST